ncbi:NUDIX hydrolase [Angustibacter sp. McL0619]|uniref:NUDIX hydrolase n=1 Tax=Angustibacter sp. McL0619 TaxID=3415676 RepID=UPI003CF8C81E
MAAPPVHSRPLYLLALRIFRRLPAPVRRSLVRAGTPGFTVGAVCLLERDDRLLMLRQPHRVGWSLPGGLLDRGESAADAVVREVSEELGLRIEVGRPVTVVVDSPLRRVDVIFRVQVEGEVSERVGGEATTARWLRADEVDEMDGPTMQILAAARDVQDAAGYVGRVVRE